MEAFWIGYSLIIGTLLAAADGAAIEIARIYGRRPGLAMFVAAVVVPFAVLFCLSPKVALGSAAFGTFLSCVALWLKQQEEKEKRGEPTSWFLRLI